MEKIAQILEQNILEQQEDQIEGLQNHQDDHRQDFEIESLRK